MPGVDENIAKTGRTAGFPKDRFRKGDWKKIQKLARDFRKHGEHHVGISLVATGLENPCGCKWFVMTTACDDCKKILAQGLIDPHNALSIAQLMGEMEETARLQAEIAARPPPETERE
ncbi:MAG: hypothetical protein OK454_03245 [Thaumarchaeota archaeon]|nr:hypothetical protein [Nitrososphaerota archaeon]